MTWLWYLSYTSSHFHAHSLNLAEVLVSLSLCFLIFLMGIIMPFHRSCDYLCGDNEGERWATLASLLLFLLQHCLLIWFQLWMHFDLEHALLLCETPTVGRRMVWEFSASACDPLIWRPFPLLSSQWGWRVEQHGWRYPSSVPCWEPQESEFLFRTPWRQKISLK